VPSGDVGVLGLGSFATCICNARDATLLRTLGIVAFTAEMSPRTRL
jgi:hypothetical protein